MPESVIYPSLARGELRLSSAVQAKEILDMNIRIKLS